MYNLFFLIENELLKFHVSENETRFYFTVNNLEENDVYNDYLNSILENLKIDRAKRILPTYYIDQNIINPFTDLEMLRKAGILKKKDIYYGFEYYITNSCSNEIRKYIHFSRKGEGNEDVFQEFIDLYKLFNH